MNKEDFTISYPAIYAGTEKSHIEFIDGVPDLVKIYNPGGKDTSERRLFVTDATVANLDCMKPFIAMFDDDSCNKDELIILGSGEPYKTIDSVLEIAKRAINAGFTRKDIFVGIGGGVICDMTAFAASIFKRGVAVEFVPTTLLAMVDASIGGKTGCDFDSYKNMIGSFHPAQKLYYFPQFVLTLPENQFTSGLAEAFKTAVLFNEDLYKIFKTKTKEIKNRDKDILRTIIQECVKAKAKVVEEDFREQGIRATLNLGHTFGHALETVAGLGTITHGEAVAWGIGRACVLSWKKEYCKEAFKNEILSILEEYGWETKPVPSIIQGGGFGERLLSVMKKDKKNLSAKIRMIIPRNIKDIVIEETEDAEILSVLKKN